MIGVSAYMKDSFRFGGRGLEAISEEVHGRIPASCLFRSFTPGGGAVPAWVGKREGETSTVDTADGKCGSEPDAGGPDFLTPELQGEELPKLPGAIFPSVLLGRPEMLDGLSPQESRPDEQPVGEGIVEDLSQFLSEPRPKEDRRRRPRSVEEALRQRIPGYLPQRDVSSKPAHLLGPRDRKGGSKDNRIDKRKVDFHRSSLAGPVGAG